MSITNCSSFLYNTFAEKIKQKIEISETQYRWSTPIYIDQVRTYNEKDVHNYIYGFRLLYLQIKPIILQFRKVMLKELETAIM